MTGPTKLRLVITGDSFVEGVGGSNGGWAQMLSRRLTDISVEIFGIGGHTTRELKQRSADEIGDDAALVIIGIGINDSRIRPSLGQNEVPLEDFGANVNEIVSNAVRSGAACIVVGLTTVDELQTTPFKEDKIYKNNSMSEFDAVLRTTALNAGASYVGLPSLAAIPDALADGLHPSNTGHRMILESVEPEVRRLLSEMASAK